VGRPFQSFLDFIGDYSGNYDGRACELLVFANPENNDQLVFRFHDLVEETYWAIAVDTLYNAGNIPQMQLHSLGDAYLWESDSNVQPQGGNQIHWDNLSIHTWDIDYLSGVSDWDGQWYGMSFTRK
jgi:hypothetical protein